MNGGFTMGRKIPLAACAVFLLATSANAAVITLTASDPSYQLLNFSVSGWLEAKVQGFHVVAGGVAGHMFSNGALAAIDAADGEFVTISRLDGGTFRPISAHVTWRAATINDSVTPYFYAPGVFNVGSGFAG